MPSSKNNAGPVVTVALVAVNYLCFLFQVLDARYGLMPNLLGTLGMTPTQVIETLANGDFTQKVMSAGTIFTAMFLHLDYFHLIGNMLLLYLAGRAVEAHLGKMRFLVFYLLGGFAGWVVQIVVTPGAWWPNVGASGAVLSVFGGHMVLLWLEKNRYCAVSALESLVYVGYLSGQLYALLNYSHVVPWGAPVVAWGAHVGGAAAGLVLAGMWLTYGLMEALGGSPASSPASACYP